MPDLAVRLAGVVKRFGDLIAVDHLDLEVPAGVCFGVLGPNGAGKSTTMRLLTGQGVADAGTVEVLGLPLPAASREVRSRCGVVPQVDNLDDELTVAENLEVWARLYGLSRSERGAAVTRGLKTAHLVERRDTPADELSGGMRRRLLIARGLVNDPEVLLLDEPTVGLDPQIRQELWTQIDEVRAHGTTIVLTTHYIEEAERLCDEVAIVNHGRVVVRGRPDDLIATHVGREVVEVPGDVVSRREIRERAADLGLATRDAGTTVAILGVEDVDPDGMPGRRRAATLEDVFVVLTGEELQ
jgi:lipooligosaccharide transport system ATP-binding protein